MEPDLLWLVLFTSLAYELTSFQFVLVHTHAYGEQWSQASMLELLVYSTVPREDELAEFQELNLARGNGCE